MCKKLIYSMFVIMLLSIASSVQAEPFSIPPDQDVGLCNDDTIGPDDADRGSGMHARDIEVRRRVGIVVYDMWELGGPGTVVSNVSLSNYGHDVGLMAVYGIIEEQDDNIDENTITWNTAPGVQNDPTPPVGSPVALDFNDLTELLFTFTAPPRGERESTEPNQALADFINSDTDGIVALLFAPGEPGANGIVRTKELDVGGTYLEGDYIPSPYAHAPNPAIGQIEVRRDVILSWMAGVYADKHDVYLGTDVNDVNEASPDNPLDVLASLNQDDTSYDPGLLDYGLTYFWRVDEVNDAEADSPWKGRIWNFTVGNFLVVDDFEDYDADENQIWFVWKDGYGYGMQGTPTYYPGNGTGSAVGDENSPTYMELDTVHGGDQSCPFVYNNGSAPFYSEIQREWEAPQDWTVEDVVTLTLFVYGDEGNPAEPLYVVVEDSAGKSNLVANLDPAAVQIEDWEQWDIALSDFSDAGVDITAVKKMSIGVGNKAAPQMGGMGSLLIDDIRLYRPAPEQ